MATLFQPYTIVANTAPTSNTTGYLRDHCGEIVYDGFGNPLIANITIVVDKTIQRINESIPKVPPTNLGVTPSILAPTNITAIINACDDVGLTTKDAKCTLIAIVGATTGWDSTNNGMLPIDTLEERIKYQKLAKVDNINIDIVNTPDSLKTNPNVSATVAALILKSSVPNYASAMTNNTFVPLAAAKVKETKSLYGTVGGVSGTSSLALIQRLYDYFFKKNPLPEDDPEANTANTSVDTIFDSPETIVEIKEAEAAEPNPSPKRLNEPTNSRLARNYKPAETIVGPKKDTVIQSVPVACGGSFSEPPTKYNAKNPHNMVMETKSGHVFELDDTPGAERVHIYHRAGTFIEMHPDGDVVVKSNKTSYHLSMGDFNIYVAGDCNVTAEKSIHMKTKGDFCLEVGGNANFNISGALKMEAKGESKFYSDSTTTIQGSTVQLNPGSGRENPDPRTFNIAERTDEPKQTPLTDYEKKGVEESKKDPNVPPALKGAGAVPLPEPITKPDGTKVPAKIPDTTPPADCAIGQSPQEKYKKLCAWLDNELIIGGWSENGPGKPGNPKILKLYSAVGRAGDTTDQTAWCAGFVSYALKTNCFPGKATLASQGYKGYGKSLPLNDPSQWRLNDIVVFTSKTRPGFGHVGFYRGYDPTTAVIKVLGGNQNNTLNLTNFLFDGKELVVTYVSRDWTVSSDFDKPIAVRLAAGGRTTTL